MYCATPEKAGALAVVPAGATVSVLVAGADSVFAAVVGAVTACAGACVAAGVPQLTNKGTITRQAITIIEILFMFSPFPMNY